MEDKKRESKHSSIALYQMGKWINENVDGMASKAKPRTKNTKKEKRVKNVQKCQKNSQSNRSSWSSL